MDGHEHLLNVLSIGIASQYRYNSSTFFLSGNPGINTFLDEEKTLIFHLSCAQLRTKIPWQTPLIVICHMITHSTDFTHHTSTILSEMVKQATDFTRDPILILIQSWSSRQIWIHTWSSLRDVSKITLLLVCTHRMFFAILEACIFIKNNLHLMFFIRTSLMILFARLNSLFSLSLSSERPVFFASRS